MKYDKVFVPVSVNERLPNKQSGQVFAINRNGALYTPYARMIGKEPLNWVTYWLEEKENVYIISEDLYNDLIEYFDNRADADGDSQGFYPNEEMKLLSQLKQ